MQTAPIPTDEKDRLASLKRLQILDTAPEQRFDRITNLAAKIFGVPISTISLVDSNREWFKSVCGIDQTEGDRAISFCGHAMLEEDMLVIPDAKADPRFSDNPMVVGEPFIRFYAGVPLSAADGKRIGTFCVKGHEPKQITEEDRETLRGLAKWAELEINMHNLSIALDQMKKSVGELDIFFETTDDIMAIANTNGFFERVNPSFTKLLGYTNEDLITQPFISFIHPDDIDATNEEVKKLAGGARTINFSNRYRKKDGMYVTLQWNVSPRGASLYAIGRDVTASHDAEEKLRYYYSLIEQSGDAIISEDLNGKIISWNPAAERMFGYQASEAIGQDIHIIVPKEYDNVAERLDRIARGFKMDASETVRKTKDGTLMNVSVSMAPIKDSKGTVTASSVVYRDITEQNMIREQLEHERVEFKKLAIRSDFAMKSAKIGVWEWDIATNTLTWDDTMYAIYGISKTQFSGAYEAWKQGLHPDDVKAGEQALQDALAGKKEFDTKFRVVWPDASVHDVRAYGLVERDVHHKPIRMVGVNWDITKEAVVDKEKTEFVSLASHQLKTPVGAIQWNLEMLLAGDYGALTDKQKEVLQESYTMNTRINELINGLLNISRLEMGVFIIEPTPTDFKKLCDEVLKEMEPRRMKKKHSLTASYDPELPTIPADPKLLRIVFQNFISNAIKYTPDSGNISVTLKSDGHNLTFSVANNGEPIPEADQSKIFQKMFRASNAQIQDADGNGLGLYVVKQIVENGGGRIWFTSKPGEDTVFACSFPLSGMIRKAGTKQLA